MGLKDLAVTVLQFRSASEKHPSGLLGPDWSSDGRRCLHPLAKQSLAEAPQIEGMYILHEIIHLYTLALQIHLAFRKAAILKARSERG